MTARAWLANRAWQGANAAEAGCFARALQYPWRAQERKLSGYLRANAGTAFAREHGLTASTSPAEFRRRVPVASYADVARYIERIAAGEPAVLTAEPVELFTPTSGSTGAEKLIPRTATLRREFARALAPWVNGLFAGDPSLRDGPAYWSISPAGERCAQRRGVVPVGFGEDDEYLSAMGRWIARAVRAVPGEVARSRSIDAWRHDTLVHLLRARSLAMVSVWHPSFLALLLDAMAEGWDRLLADERLGRERRGELRRMAPGDVRGIWPRLRLVSCWADGSSAPHARALEGRLQGVAVQGKGLLATEAFVTVPWGGMHPVALRSHLVELEDERGGVHWLDEARPGESYVPIVTTGGGLWRYRIPDRVVVDGMVERTPSLRFVGREDTVSDLRGEKLSDGFVGSVLAACEQRFGVRTRFSVLAARDDGGRAGYAWAVDADGDTAACADAIDRALCANPHYGYARRIGQLGPVAVVRVRGDAARGVLERARSGKMAAGAVKPVSLCIGAAAGALCGAMESVGTASGSGGAAEERRS